MKDLGYKTKVLFKNEETGEKESIKLDLTNDIIARLSLEDIKICPQCKCADVYCTKCASTGFVRLSECL